MQKMTLFFEELLRFISPGINPEEINYELDSIFGDVVNQTSDFFRNTSNIQQDARLRDTFNSNILGSECTSDRPSRTSWLQIRAKCYLSSWLLKLQPRKAFLWRKLAVSGFWCVVKRNGEKQNKEMTDTVTKRYLTGKFEEYVLLAIIKRNNNTTGKDILDELEKHLERNISIGALHTTLDRLIKKGLVESSKGEKTPVKGGRAKRYFSVSEGGKRALRQIKQEDDKMWSGIKEQLLCTHTT